MNKHQALVKEMMELFGQKCPDTPSLDDYPYKMRADCLLEEVMEFIEASGCKVVDGKLTEATLSDVDWPEMIDALVDILVFVYGAANSMGVDLEPFFCEVHRSNMAKIGPEGEIIRREDGKVLKPEGWQPPRIKSMLWALLHHHRDER